MVSVEARTKKNAVRGLKKPVLYSWIVDVDTVAPDVHTLLGLINKLDITAKASKHVEDRLYLWIGEFHQRLGSLLGVYRARTYIDGMWATPRNEKAYAKRLEKYLFKTNSMPRDPRYWPPSVRYNRAVIDGAPPQEAVTLYSDAIHSFKAQAGQPPAINEDMLILDTFALITSYGVRSAEARQYTELVLKTCGVEVPNIGDDDGRALRFIQDRERKRRGQ